MFSRKRLEMSPTSNDFLVVFGGKTLWWSNFTVLTERDISLYVQLMLYVAVDIYKFV